jgi:hypothetical protein
MKTIRELENELLAMQSATNPKTGQRVVEYDHRYKMECFQRGVEIADRKHAEGLIPPRISREQLHHINGVNREHLDLLAKAQGAVNPKTGKRYFEENPGFKQNVQSARARVFDGKPLSPALIADTQKLIEQK